MLFWLRKGPWVDGAEPLGRSVAAASEGEAREMLAAHTEDPIWRNERDVICSELRGVGLPDDYKAVYKAAGRA